MRVGRAEEGSAVGRVGVGDVGVDGVRVGSGGELMVLSLSRRARARIRRVGGVGSGRRRRVVPRGRGGRFGSHGVRKRSSVVVGGEELGRVGTSAFGRGGSGRVVGRSREPSLSSCVTRELGGRLVGEATSWGGGTGGERRSTLSVRRRSLVLVLVLRGGEVGGGGSSGIGACGRGGSHDCKIEKKKQGIEESAGEEKKIAAKRREKKKKRRGNERFP